MTLRGAAMIARACCLAVLATSILAINSNAGWNTETRKSCNVFVKYRCRATMIYWQGFHQSYYLCPGGCVDKGCGFAAQDQQWIDQTTGFINAEVHKRVGSGAYSGPTQAYNAHYTAGNAFIPPRVIGSDSMGVARTTMNADVTITEDAAGTLITLNNFTGGLRAKTGSSFGSAFRCIGWRSANAADSILSKQNLFADGAVRIEGGQVITTGAFNASDFVVSSTVDPTGYTVVVVTPAPGLTKAFRTPVIAGDYVALSMFGDVGYGTYNQDHVFLASTVPGLSGWAEGAVCLALLMTGGGLAVSKRITGKRRKEVPA